ncbi:MAG: 30S ribosomal protein S6 [Hyphomicrobium sp.]
MEQGGGKVTKSEYWGVKSLAYKIKKSRKAHFSLLNIDARPRPWPKWSGAWACPPRSSASSPSRSRRTRPNLRP